MSPYRRPSSNPSPNTKLHLPLLPRIVITRLVITRLALAGLALGKVAELNGFPGPKHVLELDDSLRLTENQRSETERIFTRMRKHAQGAGRVRFQR